MMGNGKKKYLTNQKQTLNMLKNNILRVKWWAHLDLNQGPLDYESSALTN